MAGTRYGVQIVGTKALENITDANKLEMLLTKMLEAMAKTAYQKVQSRLEQIPFKKPTGTVLRALRWQSGPGYAAVYMDDNIAPYAVHIERGVQPHTMRYLLKASSSIPLKVGNATIYRRATNKWMGRPHPAVDPYSGLVFMTKGWQHPGYDGKFFMREGFLEMALEAHERAPNFVFRLFSIDENSAGETL